MKVKQSVIDKVNNVDARRRISERMNIGDQMLYKHLKQNSTDGELTKAVALLAISREAQVPVMEILEADCDADRELLDLVVSVNTAS